MRSPRSRIILACAGSGKTTRLVKDALLEQSGRVAMVTYTNNNANGIEARFGEFNSGVPTHVDVMTWYSFLLRECARPYQRTKYDNPPIERLIFVNQRSVPYAKEWDTRQYYLSPSGGMYSDKISRFIVECEKMSGGAVTARLRRIYSQILIDEFQDLSGWDLEVIYALLKAGIRVTLVGDPRQHIYSTNPAKKNQQFLGTKILPLLKKWEANGLCSIETLDTSYRCPQEICDFANLLWPGMPRMNSDSSCSEVHRGVHLVDEGRLNDYMRAFQPKILVHSRKSKNYGFDALNFGLAKGLQFKHVLIVPTGPIKKYLQTGNVEAIQKGRDRLHVAVTRASASVGFIYSGASKVVPTAWEAKA